MNIVHVTPVYHPALRYGGPVVAVHGLCSALAARGHRVSVITTNVDGPGISDVPLDRPVDRDGVEVRYFPVTSPRRAFRAPTMVESLRRQIAAADIVHIHQMFHWPSWVAARIARRYGVPYVISPRGMLVSELIRRRSTLAKTLWIALFDRSSLEQAAAIHATSHLEQTELQRLGLRLPRIAVIANGVADPPASPEPEAVSPDVRAAAAAGDPIVLYFGRLSWKKGIERLIRAFAKTYGGTLVIAGTDDERRYDTLAGLAFDLGIRNRVRIVPRTIDGADKEYLFNTARVFALPSYSENFGNTVLEAMRRGVPVITTPQVGAMDIVRSAGGGVVTSGDADGLSYAMSRFLHHPALARSMGVAGQNHVTEQYGWPRIAERIEEFYESLVP